jgi:hypothetical protein
MGKFTLVLVSLLFWASGATQTKNSTKSDPCNQTMAFCWYGDEVEAWGRHWVAQDPSEKPIESSSGIRCIKRLSICAKAVSDFAFGKNFVGIEILTVTHWDAQQITADGENRTADQCEKDTYILNKLDRTVLLVASPGPKSDTPACSNIVGKPKTVVYKLTQ